MPILHHYNQSICISSKHSVDLPSIVLLAQIFATRICHATSTELNHPHFSYFPSLRRKFHPNSIFSRTDILWNKFPHGYFTESYNVNLFKSMFNHYLSIFTFCRHLFHSYHTSFIVTHLTGIVYLEWFLIFVLVEL